MHQQTRTGLLLLTISALSFNTAYAGSIAKAKAANGQMIDAVTKQVIVKYKTDRLPQGQVAIKNLSAIILKNSSLNKLGFDIIKVPAGETIDSFVQKLKANPDIETAEPNGIVHAFAADPQLSQQYYLFKSSTTLTGTTGGASDISQGATSVVIAVIDSGVTLNHVDLQNQLWVNPAPSGNSGLHGTRIAINFDEPGTCYPNQTAGSDPTDDNVDLPTICGGQPGLTHHGTHVAGIIAAESNNGSNIAGIAPLCKIMAVKVLNLYGEGTDASVAEGIIYAADNGASVINLSLGGSIPSSIGRSAVNYALAKDIVIVAATGNDGVDQVSFPAAYDGVIAVGATDENDDLAYFSNTGPEIDVVAPGVDILSLNKSGSTPENGSSTGDGTSFASPIVAGIAGLVRSLNPNLSYAAVTRYIDFNADDLGGAGFDKTYGYGRVNAFRTLVAVNGGQPPAINSNETFPYPNPFNPTTGSVTISLPHQWEPISTSKVTVFNLNGEPIKVLNNTLVWDGRNDEGNYLASGLYYYYAETDKGHVKGKLTVLR